MLCFASANRPVSISVKCRSKSASPVHEAATPKRMIAPDRCTDQIFELGAPGRHMRLGDREKFLSDKAAEVLRSPHCGWIRGLSIDEQLQGHGDRGCCLLHPSSRALGKLSTLAPFTQIIGLLVLRRCLFRFHSFPVFAKKTQNHSC